MTLNVFIRKHKEEISQEWIKYAQENLDPTNDMDLDEIRDHIMEMLDRIADDMDSSQSDSEQESKSKGNKQMTADDLKAAIDHGEQRVTFGFDILQLSSEFRALRASVLRLWDKKSREENWKNDFHDMIRFNEAIDELWMISVQHFQGKLDQSKHWFLGILGHDLRNPITTITAANSILKLSQNLSEREKKVLQQSDSSVKRMRELINNLLELTELRLGTGMDMKKEEMNLTTHSKDIVKEIQLAYPETKIVLEPEENVMGQWDVLRLEQMITNLVTNAIRHGKPKGEVRVHLCTKDATAFLSVHNDGAPIPEDLREKIFESKFSRNNNGSGFKEKSYGLGLFIVKEIVEGHGGKIQLTSSKKEGTTFTIALPKS